jgi:hypothetical protein
LNSRVIREAMMQRHMTNLFRFLEPLFRRVVQEEIQAGLMQSPRYIERSPATPPAERPAWKLAFRTPPQLPIFTGSKIEDASGAPLEIVLVDADTGSPAASRRRCASSWSRSSVTSRPTAARTGPPRSSRRGS